MATQLKHFYNEDLVTRLGTMINNVYAPFQTKRFIQLACEDLESHELMGRAKHIMVALTHELPTDFVKTKDILVQSLGPELAQTDGWGMDVFLYLPHVLYVAEHGLGHFEHAMDAQYEITKRFSCEFSIRPYLQHHQDKTLAILHQWTKDPNVHVRRLVSEGTRPRLPWASRLKAFQQDPTPVLKLLDKLKDDPEIYVRRSVANNLNDIGKDHPDLLVQVCEAWSRNASKNRSQLIKHALRSQVKAGHQSALKVLGFADAPNVKISNVKLSAKHIQIGEAIKLQLTLRSKAEGPQNLVVDICVHYVKANGKTSTKVFKLQTLTLAPQADTILSHTLSLRQMSTRKLYPGKHHIDVLINGKRFPLAEFELTA